MKKMKKKWGLILAPVAVIAVCLSLIAGSTFALFTSESSVGITISAGTVAVTSKVENVSATAKEIVWNADGSYTVTENEGTPGADAKFENGVLGIDGMLPGDTVSFDIVMENAGDEANVQYAIECKKGIVLMDALDITIGETNVQHLKKYTSAWDKLPETGKTVHVAMTLPVENESANGESAEIAVNVFAVQENVVMFGNEEDNKAVTETIPAAEVATETEFTEALGKGGFITLAQDVVLPKATTQGIKIDKETAIDLAGNTLSVSSLAAERIHNFNVVDGAELTVLNGKVVATEGRGEYSIFKVLADSKATLKNVTTESVKMIISPEGEGATVVIEDCKLNTTGYYVIGTNAATDAHYGVNVSVKNSSLTVDNQYGTAVLCNIPGEYEFSDCTITGVLEAVVVRSGNVTLTDCDLINDSRDYNAYNNDKKWDEGNHVTTGCLVVGSKGDSAYQEAKATLRGKCSLTHAGTAYAIVAWGSVNGAILNNESELTINSKNDLKYCTGEDAEGKLTITGIDINA